MRFGPYVKASGDNRKTPIEVSRLWSHCMLFLLILKAAVVQSSMHVPHCKNGDLSNILICTLTRWAKFLVEILVCLLNWINNFLLKTECRVFHQVLYVLNFSIYQCCSWYTPSVLTQSGICVLESFVEEALHVQKVDHVNSVYEPSGNCWENEKCHES